MKYFKHLLGGLALSAGLSMLAAGASAAPMCSGPTSLTDLGAEGCTFGDLTFSDFSFSGNNGQPFGGTPLDPGDVLINVFDTTLALNIIDRVPGIGLVATPRDPALWETNSGLFTQLNFALSYIVSAVGATFDRYQVAGSGPGSSLRGPSFRVSMGVDAGDQVVSTGSNGPFLQVGTVTPGTTQIAVNTSGSAVPGLGGFGTTFIGSVTNIFTVNPAPVSLPGTLGLAFTGLLILSRRRPAQTRWTR